MIPVRMCLSCAIPYIVFIGMNSDSENSRCPPNISKSIKYIFYEESNWRPSEPDKTETQGLYVFLSIVALLAGLLLLGFDILLGSIGVNEEPPRRIDPPQAQHQCRQQGYMHFNTSASTSDGPQLARQEYWL